VCESAAPCDLSDVNEINVIRHRLAPGPLADRHLDVGFQTKSNFNREFLRVTGMSPSARRAAKRRMLDRANGTGAAVPT
jgi:AraC-like DNA-binding protein